MGFLKMHIKHIVPRIPHFELVSLLFHFWIVPVMNFLEVIWHFFQTLILRTGSGTGDPEILFDLKIISLN